MKANELRVNVFVNDTRAKQNIQITDLDAWRIAEDYHYFEPIPLTEEWLEKFGFIKYDQMGDWSFWNYKLPTERHWNLGILSKGVHVSFGSLNWDDCPIVHHVHELQNLYFAITGNELILIK